MSRPSAYRLPLSGACRYAGRIALGADRLPKGVVLSPAKGDVECLEKNITLGFQRLHVAPVLPVCFQSFDIVGLQVLELPDIRAGLLMRGTRLGVYEVASIAEHIPSYTALDELLETYPSLTSELVAYAREYASTHPPVVTSGRRGGPPGARLASTKVIELSQLDQT